MGPLRLAFAAILATVSLALAQTTPTAPASPPTGGGVTTQPLTPPPAMGGPAAAAPSPSAEAPTVIPAPDMAKPSGDASTGIGLTLEAKPALVLRGSAIWEDGYTKIREAQATIAAEAGKAGLKTTGKPMTVFVETDDNGFRYEAMMLLEAPTDKTTFGGGVQAGKSPAGKVMKFQHRGAYDDIDATYEAITAYLDEKGLEAQNLFVEEYLNDVKASDDTCLEVDIYVFIK